MKGRLAASFVVTRAVVGATAGGGIGATAAARRATARPADATCATPDVTTPRDPSNPLALPTPPAAGDPLNGAHFFVDGRRHGRRPARSPRCSG